jgi:hypothetical protein
MKMRPARFNIYLLTAFGLLLLAVGCRTPEDKEHKEHSKDAATFRVFLASKAAEHAGVAVYRSSPIELHIDHEPLLTEGDLESAAVVEAPGGYTIQAQFNGHGALVLEGATVGHKGQHLAIQSTWTETRWLGAPVITHRISNGQLVFTPDATREESERIVRGLSNVVAKIKADSML